MQRSINNCMHFRFRSGDRPLPLQAPLCFRTPASLAAVRGIIRSPCNENTCMRWWFCSAEKPVPLQAQRCFPGMATLAAARSIVACLEAQSACKNTPVIACAFVSAHVIRSCRCRHRPVFACRPLSLQRWAVCNIMAPPHSGILIRHSVKTFAPRLRILGAIPRPGEYEIRGPPEAKPKIHPSLA